ncbi:MAG: diadenosine tetraphosphatase [Ignavibacteriales bacterium CG18_big_fil_WC_8_21_14_2_50_31_20]|nr:MAG: diadenosine tetraphosphatase [Ignavibacteriales bacterium CG18_big_fil_WC_8_21_14_2_50_31_20]
MIAVIGDIHGCYHTLVELYNKIIKKYPDLKVYSVGDLIDRGNNSCDVMEFVIEKKIEFTPGNHEYMFYNFFKEPSSVFARSWVFNGSEATLESYEDNEEKVFSHIDVIKKAPFYINTQDCFISHAGISKEYEHFLPKDFRTNLSALHELIYNDYRSDRGVLWCRDEPLNIGKLQIIGHTKHQEIILDEDNNAVYIDTGAYVGNKLSAIIVEKEQIIDVIDVKTHLNDII